MVLDAQLSWKESSQHCIQWCISIPKMPFRLEKMQRLCEKNDAITVYPYLAVHMQYLPLQWPAGALFDWRRWFSSSGKNQRRWPQGMSPPGRGKQTLSIAPCPATIQTPSMAPCFCNHTNTWYSTVPCPATIQTPSTAPCPVTIQTPSTAPCPVTIQTSSISPCPATIQTPSIAPCPVTIQTPSIAPCPVTIQTPSIAP